jgi:hypothetical protein
MMPLLLFLFLLRLRRRPGWLVPLVQRWFQLLVRLRPRLNLGRPRPVRGRV